VSYCSPQRDFDWSISDVCPPLPKRPSSSIMADIRSELGLDERHEEKPRLQSDSRDSPVHANGTTAYSFSAKNGGKTKSDADDYEYIPDVVLKEEDSSGAGDLGTKLTCAPPLRIERKIFSGDRLPRSLSIVSSSTGSRELLNCEMNSSTCSQYDTDVVSTFEDGSNASCTGARVERSIHSTTDSSTSVTLTPKEVPSPLTPFLPIVPPNSPLPVVAEGQQQHASQFVSALVTMPRCKKDAQRFFPSSPMQDVNGGTYGPMTIDRKGYKKGYFDTSAAILRPKPPTPPIRRLPSWVRLITI